MRPRRSSRSQVHPNPNPNPNPYPNPYPNPSPSPNPTPNPDNTTAKDLPKETPALHALVEKHAKGQLSGLAACLWRPPKGCTNETQYQCLSGEHAGECSRTNWYERSH